MSRTVTDSRQIISRALLEMLADKSHHTGTTDAKPADTTELDNLLSSINSEFQPSFLLSESSTPDLTVTVGSATVTNPETSKNRVSPKNSAFAGGTIVFPASSGGTITVTTGTNKTLTVSSGNYIKCLVEINTSDEIEITLGTEGASEAAATLPALNHYNTPVGYIVVHNTGGTIDNVSNSAIYQFTDNKSTSDSLMWNDVDYKDNTDSPISLTEADAGKLLSIDCSSGAVTVNLPEISTLDFNGPLVFGIKKSDSSENAITINRGGASDVIDGATSKSIDYQYQACALIPDTDATPDEWTALDYYPYANGGGPNEHIHAPVADITALKAVSAARRFDDQIIVVSSGPSGDPELWRFDASSSETANDVDIVQPTSGTGRWHIIPTGGGGVGGINYLEDDNFDFEGSIGDWIAYDDGSVDEPVDATGGSPGITLARTITGSEVLLGDASAKVTYDAADRQGEGVSCAFAIDRAYEEAKLKIQFNFDVISGSFVEGDFAVWVIDVDNGGTIEVTPSKDILPAKGVFEGSFLATDSTNYRIAIHRTVTDATAVTFVFDNAIVGPQTPSLAPAAGPATQFNFADLIDASTTAPTVGGVLEDNCYWLRDKDHMYLWGTFRQNSAGSAGSGDYYLTVPENLSIDTSFYTSQALSKQLGRVGEGSIDNTSVADEDLRVHVVSATQLGFTYTNSAANGTVWNSSNLHFGGADLAISFKAKIKILGWSPEVASTQTRSYWMAPILENGTRVTSTPSKFGEYRTYVKNSSAITGSDTAPTSGWTPTGADGMRMDAVVYGSAGTAGQPGRYEIYIGKNKNFDVKWYNNSGKSGNLDTQFEERQSNAVYGVIEAYDPSTGVLTLDAITQDSTTTVRRIGQNIPTAGGGRGAPTDGYFDILVYEAAIPVQLENSYENYSWFITGSGHGSSGSRVRTWVTLEEKGSATTGVSDSTNGDYIKVNESGWYAVEHYDIRASGIVTLGVSKGASGGDFATSIFSLAKEKVVFRLQGPTNQDSFVSTVQWFDKGTELRAHDTGSNDSATSERAWFRVSKVA